MMGEWRHNNGYLINHTMRIAKEDFDTNPSEEYKKEVFDYLCEAANNYKDLQEQLEHERELSQRQSTEFNNQLGKALEQLEQKDKELDDLSGAISKWQAQHSDRIDEKNKLKARNEKLESTVEQIANATIDTPNVVAEDFIAIAQEALNQLNDDQRIEES